MYPVAVNNLWNHTYALKYYLTFLLHGDMGRLCGLHVGDVIMKYAFIIYSKITCFFCFCLFIYFIKKIFTYLVIILLECLGFMLSLFYRHHDDTHTHTHKHTHTHIYIYTAFMLCWINYCFIICMMLTYILYTMLI